MSSAVQLLLTACVPAAIGVALALFRVGRIARWAVYALLFSVSIGLTYGSDIVREQDKRFEFLVDGIMQTGLLSLVLHVLPAIVLYWVTRRILRKRTSVKGASTQT